MKRSQEAGERATAARHKQQIDALNASITALRNRPPIVKHVHHGGGGGGCIIS